jgi:hypothetical protein
MVRFFYNTGCYIIDCPTYIQNKMTTLMPTRDLSNKIWEKATSPFIRLYCWHWVATACYGYKIYYHCNFYNCLTKFRYYYNYYVLIFQCKVELYITNNLIIHLSIVNELLWNLWVQIYFLWNFSNLISGTCSSILNYFGMHVEIHLICRK